jgi:hypothetical protein
MFRTVSTDASSSACRPRWKPPAPPPVPHMPSPGGPLRPGLADARRSDRCLTGTPGPTPALSSRHFEADFDGFRAVPFTLDRRSHSHPSPHGNAACLWIRTPPIRASRAGLVAPCDTYTCTISASRRAVPTAIRSRRSSARCKRASWTPATTPRPRRPNGGSASTYGAQPLGRPLDSNVLPSRYSQTLVDKYSQDLPDSTSK